MELGNVSDWVTAASTFVLAVLTAFLWWENRRLRNAGVSPEMVAHLAPHADGNGAVELVFSNVGRGPAFNVSFSFVCSDDDFAAHNVKLLNDPDRPPFSVIPQNEAIRAFFGIGFELYGNLGEEQLSPLMPFEVTIGYYDVLGRHTETTRNIDIRQFAGIAGIVSKSNGAKMAQSLEKIERHLARLSGISAQSLALIDVTKLSDSIVQKIKGDSR